MTGAVHHHGGEAADGGQVVSASTPAIWSGSAGRKPSGPSSVAASPTSRISPSTRLGESW